MATPDARTAANGSADKPHDDEIDVFGLTHTGKVRETNQDHFLICSLGKRIQVHLTSLPDPEQLTEDPERLAFLAMVADGVGSSEQGGEASRLALGAITKYVTRGLQTYYSADVADDEAFSRALEDAALHCHQEIETQGKDEPEKYRMATTLTMWIGIWPKAYLLQVGDSRCYLYRKGELTQISRDQTMAQELIDEGVMTRTDATGTRLEHILSSSIGGPTTRPVVTTLDQSWDNVGLLCSDGLTKHVSDERIAERLSTMTSAKQVCEDLLQDALDDGGRDNISIVVGRIVRRR